MPEFLNEEFKKQIEDCLLHCDTGEAKVLAENLRRGLIILDNDYKASDEERIFWYNYLPRLELQALPLFSNEELAEIFRKNLLEMVNDEEINIYERFKSKQMVIHYELMEDFLILMIEAIHANEQKIGQNGIFVPGQPEAVAPTVKNWLLDYDRTYGTEAQEELVWLTYVAQSRNASTLSADEKSLLRKVLKFYEFLKPEYAEEE